MTIFEMFFFTTILFGVIIGIAGGVHCAYSLALKDIEPEGDGYHVFPKAQQSVKDKGTDSNEEKNAKYEPAEVCFGKKKQEKKSKLKERVRKHEQMSFSEFDCQFTDEDRDEKLHRVMQEQNDSYRYLEEDKVQKRGEDIQ